MLKTSQDLTTTATTAPSSYNDRSTTDSPSFDSHSTVSKETIYSQESCSSPPAQSYD
jgi:hypothetical protein